MKPPSPTTGPPNGREPEEAVGYRSRKPPPPPSQPSPTPTLERLEYRNSSTESHGEHKQINNVDFVLAYKRLRNVTTKENDIKLDDETERRRFYRELRARGILVNIDDDPTCSLDAGRTCFALLRLSQQLLRCECRCHTISGNKEENEQTVTNSKYVNDEQYSSDNGNRHKPNGKLTSATRAQIVWRIILRIGSDSQQNAKVMSIEKLLDTGIITAAYPVHDGNIKLDDGENPNNTNDRRFLYEHWARPGLIIPKQWKSDERIALLIRQYYGIPVAVYFSWLHYYTVWLVGPAIAGLLWFLYGLMTTRYDVPTREICDPKSQVAEWILCPTRRCDENYCGFTRVLDTCGVYRWTSAATFDRLGAVVFAVFMSFWTTAFQQLWTTYGWRRLDVHREVQCDGECCVDYHGAKPSGARRPPAGPDDRRPGPTKPSEEKTSASAVATRSPALRLDAVRRWYTGKLSALFRAAVFLGTLIGVAAIPILIVVYRGRVIGWLMSAVFHQEDGTHAYPVAADGTAEQQHRRHSFFLLNYANSGELSNWKTVVAALCATFVQLTAIVAVHRGYSAVAGWLTKYSYRSVYDPRFQSRFTAYMSCFDSANYYSSLVYIAFFKGRFVTGRGQPSDSGSRLSNFWPISLFRSLVLHIREDVCDPAAVGTGCVPELCIQLAIIMVAKQLIDNAIELTTPLALNVWRRWRAKESRRRKNLHEKMPAIVVETLKHPKQWQLDYQLEDTGPLGLYQEYSEMVIQYGFVVLFTTAFPLAPLCALLNNILEQRLDAYKMVAATRRPVPAYYCTSRNNVLGQTTSCCDNCTSLGTWIRVLKVLSMISVLYNAFMIAFTSDLLPRYVYSHISSETSSSLDGYVAWSLSSKRNMSEYYFGKSEDPDRPETCRYRGYGADANSDHNDNRYWQVLAVRLTFVIVFEHCVIAAITALAYSICKILNKYTNQTKNSNNGPEEHLDSKNDSLLFTGSIGSANDRLSVVGPVKTHSGSNDNINRDNVIIDKNKQRVSADSQESSSVVVVDIENDDQETWRRHDPCR